MNSDPARQLLRHTVATLAYRGGKTLRRASSLIEGALSPPVVSDDLERV